ncbi:MAG: SocA family protein [Deltaproteobacteria bacterium]|uniref:SocA family protein n=1 Tax=Candidatus Zymogenus saltonus TaxID=2844893 RepID=A0A9D8PQ17_9DELT|nr:SocA family protein [Candidatus Zymogenus saltonus]
MKKTKQLLAYLIKNHQSPTITGLMKLAYISDLVSMERRDLQMSDFEYLRYKHGPFDRNIYDYIQELLSENSIVEEPNYTTRGDEYIVYRFKDKQNVSFDELDEEDQAILDEVLEALSGYGAKALVEIAYNTKPMKKIGATQNNKKGLNQVLDLSAK